MRGSFYKSTKEIMRLRIFLVVILSVFCFSGIYAQKSSKKITIVGIVTDAEKKPVANAIIMIDNKNTSSVTDSKGHYKIKVKPEAVKIGVITFGLGVKEEDIAGRDSIDFSYAVASEQQSLEVNVSPGEEATDVGYGTMKRKYVTSQTSKVDGANKKYASYKSAYEMIQREVSGVKIDGESIIIQDSRNLWGSVPALLILDGTYVESFSDVSPASVLSIDVLKGSAAAMYGSRGYGGVVIIKTKIQND
jgi:TonB-dependent starch-binding outer membrane protein SusC